MTTKTTKRKEARLPQFHAYQVIEGQGEGQRSRWNRIGAFFAHEDGQGGTLIIDCLPIAFDGRLVLRAPLEATEETSVAE